MMKTELIMVKFEYELCVFRCNHTVYACWHGTRGMKIVHGKWVELVEIRAVDVVVDT